MRDYVSELASLGMNAEGISRNSGVSVSAMKHLKANTPEYESIRNLVRRESRRKLRASGMSPGEASRLRRTLTDPNAKPRKHNVSKVVESKSDQTLDQYYIFGMFTLRDKSSRQVIETRYGYGFTEKVRKGEYTTRQLISMAVRQAKSKLGGTNWKLKKLIEHGWKSFVLKNSTTR